MGREPEKDLGQPRRQRVLSTEEMRTVFCSSAPKKEAKDADSQSEPYFLLRDVDDACAEVTRVYFEHFRSECHKWLLGIQNFQPGGSAVVLNVYRLNFGGNPEGFAEWISTLPELHPWQAEYARANFAWNIARVGLRLVGRGAGGSKQDKHFIVIVQTLVNMSDVVPRRDLIAGRSFPLDMPTPLISWHEEQPNFVGADCEQSPLHKSSFYKEGSLRDLAESASQQAQKIDHKGKHCNSDADDSDSELSEHSCIEFGGMNLQRQSSATSLPLVQGVTDTDITPPPRRSARLLNKPLRPNYAE